MSKEPVLKAQHLGITFGGLKAVDDFCLEIGESELVGLIGPNGAGKTTVFNLLTGVYQPTEGSYYLCGQKMNGKKTHQVVAAGIARTFQNIRLFKKLTVLENVKVAMNMYMHYSLFSSIFRLSGYWKEEISIEEKAYELLDIVHLRDKVSVLLIEHDMSLVMKICERIQVIDYGVTIASGKPEEIANNPRVIEAYLGKDEEEVAL